MSETVELDFRRRTRAARSGKAWPWRYKFAPGLEALDAPRSALVKDESRMSAGCVLMTEARDREGDVMLVAGVDTSSHERLPVVMIDHGRTGWPFAVGLNKTPEGVYTVSKHPEEGLMRQVTYFRQDDETSAQIWDMTVRGMMGCSIGYRPLEVKPLPPDPVQGHWRRKDGSGGQLLARVEMTESTWTCQPANPECVREEWDRGRIGGKSLTPAVRAMLRPLLPARRAFLFTGEGKSGHDVSEQPRDEQGKFADGGGSVNTGDSIPNTEEEVTQVAELLREVILDDCGGDARNQCITATQTLLAMYPKAELWEGVIPGEWEEGGEHTIAKVGDYFVDVTGDQYGQPEVAVFTQEDINSGKYGEYESFSRRLSQERRFRDSLGNKVPSKAEKRARKVAALKSGRAGRVLKNREGKAMSDDRKPEKKQDRDRRKEGDEEESPHADEPYGSQLMKSMMSDAHAFHETYGKACKALEHAGVKRWAFKMLNAVSEHMGHGHKVHGKYYKASGVKAIEHQPPGKLSTREGGDDDDEDDRDEEEGEDDKVSLGKSTVEKPDPDEEAAAAALPLFRELAKGVQDIRAKVERAGGAA